MNRAFRGSWGVLCALLMFGLAWAGPPTSQSWFTYPGSDWMQSLYGGAGGYQVPQLDANGWFEVDCEAGCSGGGGGGSGGSVTGFTPNGASTSLSATTTAQSQSLTSYGTVIEVTNTGTNPAVVALGSTASASTSYVAAAATIPLTLGGNTALSYAATTGTTTLSVQGGSGLGYAYGGGGSSGGGGTVSQGAAAAASGAWPMYLVQGTSANSSGNPVFSSITALPPLAAGSNTIGNVGINGTVPSSAAANNYADGWSVTEGTKADTAWSGTGSASEIALFKALYGELLVGGSAGNPLYVVQGTGGNFATSANQTAVQTAAGTSATTANAIQGITGGVPVAVSGSFSISNVSGNAITSNQQTVTASAAALPSATYTNGVVVTAQSTNTGTIYVGGSSVTTSTGYPLAPGTSISYAVNNSNLIYIIGTNTTDKIAITGN